MVISNTTAADTARGAWARRVLRVGGIIQGCFTSSGSFAAASRSVVLLRGRAGQREIGDMDQGFPAMQLRDGRTVCIRPIASSDADALVHFHEALGDETTRLRFFRRHAHLTSSEVERFTHVDHHDREALVALDGPDIIAVGRFERLPGTADAEVAFVVADDWRGHGAGSHLLEQLAHRARSEGVTRFVADTLFENRRMLAVFRHSGLTVDSQTSTSVVHIALDLGAD